MEKLEGQNFKIFHLGERVWLWMFKVSLSNRFFIFPNHR